MKPSKFKYLKPSSVNEALTYLEEYADDCKIISGGQSLIPVLNMRLSTPEFLIDVSGIKELNYIREEDGYIAIGALTRHVEVENSLLIKEKCPLLIDAIKWVGHKQIRNRGTIGGSIAHGDPSAELPCVLTTLRGEIVIASVNEEEVVGPEDFFLTYLLTSLQTNQLVKEIRFPIMTQGERVGHSFVEVARRHGDFGLAIAAAVIELDNQGLIQKAQLAVGAVNFFALTCAYNSAYHLRGAYKIPNYDSECEVILTNKTPNVPFRGAGRPEVVFVMDRIIDIVARKLKVDPIEIMKKNMIQAEDMPYDQGILVKDGHQLIYDSGDYPDALRKAVDLVDYDAFRKEQEEKKKEGKLVGIGISSYVEGTGAGPYEGAHISIDPSGHVTAYLGCTPQGQGHETVFSQIAADGLGVNPQNITVRVGETTVLPMGQGTYASRSAVNAGSAIYEAALKMREKVLKIAAHLLKTDEDLVIDEGKIYAETSPEKFVTYQDVGRAALPAKLGNLPEGMEASLEVTHYFAPPTVTFAASIHMAQVEVDKETGFVDLQKYSVVHDCGTVINPMIVDGQVQGGIAQGIGSALYEEIVYDQTGQLLTGTYMDYLLPTSMEVPTVAKAHQEFKSTRNRLGIKGVGEGGAIAPPAAIANAIVDALHPLEIKTNDLPISPNKLRTWIKEAEASFQTLQTN